MLYHMYFSPTGGTRKTGAVLTEALWNALREAQGYSAELQDEAVAEVDLLQKGSKLPILGQKDLCVISVPAFGGRVPEAALEKLRSCQGEGALAVLMAVYGNRAIDDTLLELKDTLDGQGFVCLAAVEAVAEHSLVRTFGAGRPDEQDRKELEGFAKEICKRILAWNTLEEAEKKQKKDDLCTVPGNRPYKEYTPAPMSPVIGKACVKCGRCQANCPADAISSADYSLVDPAKCFSCMHCVAVCPVGARSNDPEKMKALEERLRDRCSGRKENILY